MSIFETASAFAQGAAAPSPGGGVSFIFPMLIIFIIFYFLLIRPQQKKQRHHQDMLKKLNKGEKIISTGGIHGTIVGIDDKIITLQVDEKVRIRISRNAVAGVITEE